MKNTCLSLEQALVSRNCNGREWYEYLARYHTTTDLTPDEIHEIGLQEVARIRSEMEDVMESVAWEVIFAHF